MCDGNGTGPGWTPRSAADALRLAHVAMDYLNSPAGGELAAAGIGEVLASLGGLHAKYTAAHAGLLRRFEAADAHASDGYGTPGSWLSAMAQMSRKDAKASVAEMRRLAAHPAVAQALAAGRVSR